METTKSKSVIRAEKKFKKAVKARINEKGVMNVKYLKEYIEGSDNPVALGVTELTKQHMINIIDTAIFDHQTKIKKI